MQDNLSILRRYFQDELDARLTLGGFVMLIVGMVSLSDFGLISGADGVIYALALSLLLPSLTPYLLIAICTFQDVAGLSTFWWYAGTILLGMLIVFRWAVNGGIKELMASRAAMPVMAALLVIFYATLISLLQILLHGHPQANTRHPLAVAGLMVGMIVMGVAVAAELNRDARAAERTKWLVVILVVNGLFVALMKVVFGLELFASAGGLEQVQEASQLTEPSVLGIPRLIGTYLTPNGFALCYGLVMLLVLQHQARVSTSYALVYAITGGVLGLITFSKAMVIFFLLATVILFMQTRRARILAVTAVVATFFLLVLVYATSALEWQNLASAFRISTDDTGEMGYRGQAWHLIMQTFDVADWLLGTGLAYWPILFEQNLGFSLSDPHTYLLSIPGTYGILGVMFYILIGMTLFREAYYEPGPRRALALILAALFFVKDLASIPYLIGNTPLTLLIWILISGLLLNSPAMKDRAGL